MTTIDKTIDILNKEMETLTDAQLHELFMFYYRLNHQYGNIIVSEKFDDFLASFNSNPFRIHDDKSFKKELITNLIAYTDDYMSLLTAVLLLKKKYTIEEIIDNYYSNVNLFDNNLF